MFPNVKNNHPEKTIHPCQFPVELVERLVLSMTNEGDAVLDPYVGAGSSLVAALMHDRDAYGCDVEPAYVEIAQQRIRQALRRHASHAPHGQAYLRPVEAKWWALMQIKARYSHLNGEEYLIVHRKDLLEEVQSVIADVDAFACRTTVSREKRMQGRMLYSPLEMNRAFAAGLRGLGVERAPQHILGDRRREDTPGHLCPIGGRAEANHRGRRTDTHQVLQPD